MKCRWRLGRPGLIEQRRLQQLLCGEKATFISPRRAIIPSLQKYADSDQRGAAAGMTAPLLLLLLSFPNTYCKKKNTVGAPPPPDIFTVQPAASFILQTHVYIFSAITGDAPILIPGLSTSTTCTRKIPECRYHDTDSGCIGTCMTMDGWSVLVTYLFVLCCTSNTYDKVCDSDSDSD